MKLLVSLTVVGFTLVGFVSVGTTAASAAAEVVRTFVDGRYNYTCIKDGDGHYCGNWNVVK
jgi:hypothetical protein